ncbi:hypothetical protein Scep_012591 [Stephania cephalantha]|uniref:Uncharacterized protein n=1 Tax=Stephania cephalantha TaxID=152367 RepID=A0AAP0JFF1_9MAGN
MSTMVLLHVPTSSPMGFNDEDSKTNFSHNRVKLEKRVSSFVDDPKLSYEVALKKMYSLLEKVESSVYALLRTRDMAIS